MAILVFGALLLVALMFVATLARRRGNANEQDSVAESIRIHKDRLLALDEEHQRGDLEDTDYQQFRAETERALLEDTRKASDTDPGRAPGCGGWCWCCHVGLGLVALWCVGRSRCGRGSPKLHRPGNGPEPDRSPAHGNTGRL